MRSALVHVPHRHPRASVCTARYGESRNDPQDEAVGEITDVPEWDDRARETDEREDQESNPRSLVRHTPTPIKPRTDPIPEKPHE
jgi:hypothetical protein